MLLYIAEFTTNPWLCLHCIFKSTDLIFCPYDFFTLTLKVPIKKIWVCLGIVEIKRSVYENGHQTQMPLFPRSHVNSASVNPWSTQGQSEQKADCCVTHGAGPCHLHVL